MPAVDLSPRLAVDVRVAAELFDRSSRVKLYLERIGPGESNEHRQLVKTLRRALEQVEGETIKTFGDLWDRFDDEEYKQGALDTLKGNLRRFSEWFATIHELLVFLPRQSITPELVFTLEAGFDKLYAEYSPSIVLGSIFNAFEFDFVEILKQNLAGISDIFLQGERNFVLQLAICDCDSPLSYPILGHELGHAIDAKHSISSTIAGQFVKNPNSQDAQILQSWCGEICADLAAVQALGPSPILSLLSMEYCLYPLATICQNTESHPMTRSRLRIVANQLATTGDARQLLDAEVQSYETAWRLDFESKFPDPAERQAKEQDQEVFENIILEMVKRIRQRLSELNLSELHFEQESLVRCVQRLASNSPISAQGKSRDSLREMIEAYRRRTFSTDIERRQEFEGLCRAFTEEPLEIPKILFAGHVRRCKLLEELCMERKRLGSRDSVDSFCQSLATLDGLVGNSVVTACVHKGTRDRLSNRKV